MSNVADSVLSDAWNTAARFREQMQRIEDLTWASQTDVSARIYDRLQRLAFPRGMRMQQRRRLREIESGRRASAAGLTSEQRRWLRGLGRR